MALQYQQCTQEYFDWLLGKLKSQNNGFRSDSGMTSLQIQESEQRHGLIFPSDFTRFLQHPVSSCELFYDYSAPIGSPQYDMIIGAMKNFQQGIEFDIQHNNCWPANWGKKPSSLPEKIDRFRSVYATAVKLIPIYGHRALISNFESSIVLSVHQTDIIVYGYNLAVYLQHEFLRDELQIKYSDAVGGCYSTVVPTIPFWSSFIG